MGRLSDLRIAGAEPDPTVRTFEVIALRYERELMPTKAARTQRDNLRDLDRRTVLTSIAPARVTMQILERMGTEALS